MNNYLIINDYSPCQMIIVIKKDAEFFAIQWSKFIIWLTFLVSIGTLIITQDIETIIILPIILCVLILVGFLIGGIFDDKIIWISELENNKIKKRNFLQNPKEYLNNILKTDKQLRINGDYYEKIENFLNS